MKFDKEYPATHSMETAWYAADEDGNVALIMYNDNGLPLEKQDILEKLCSHKHDKIHITIHHPDNLQEVKNI